MTLKQILIVLYMKKKSFNVKNVKHFTNFNNVDTLNYINHELKFS